MLENVERFFELYEKDPELRERVKTAEALYPGSLEIREAVAEAVLLPIAEELGCPFDLKELRKYETRKKLSIATMNDDEWLAMEDDCIPRYWLLDKGWQSNPG